VAEVGARPTNVRLRVQGFQSNKADMKLKLNSFISTCGQHNNHSQSIGEIVVRGPSAMPEPHCSFAAQAKYSQWYYERWSHNVLRKYASTLT